VKSLSAAYLSALQFSSEQVSTLRAIGECRGRQDLFTRQTPETLEALRQAAIIESSECSNRLEGITAPHHRIEALVLESSSPRNRSEQEIAGYRDALALIHESARHMDFTVNVILQLHAMIHRYLPQQGGRWKMTDNEIVERDASGQIQRVRFRAVPAVSTPQAMNDLITFYAAAEQMGSHDALVLIPLGVLDFLCIHPFSDGNGRLARLLTLLLLYRAGYEVGRYVSLERITEDSKTTYYEALEASSRSWHDGKHNVSPWLNYLWGTLLRAYREFEDRVGTLASGKGSKTVQVRRAAQKRIAPFAISDIEADCPGVSRDMVRLVLRQLRNEGLIAVQGGGRAAKWTNLKHEGKPPC
jgi:Fic family protein